MLGDMLVSERLITPEQRDRALDRQKKRGGRIGDAMVELGYLSSGELERIFHRVPPAPRDLEQVGIPETFLIDLMLKNAYFDGQVLSVADMIGKLCLPMRVVDDLVDKAKRDRLLSLRTASGSMSGTYLYELTNLGRERTELALAQSQYTGPAPITLQAYREIVAHQTVRQIEIDAGWMRQAMRQLVIGEGLMNRLGPAFNSGRSIFLYGPPGSGKSSIAEAIGRELPGEIYVPHSLMVDGQVIRIFDPALHVPVNDLAKSSTPTAQGSLDLDLGSRHDMRWVRCRRPVVMVGGELTLESLNLEYDPISKFYQAPVQMKATNGMFIVDDFGRQQIPPRQLLNRWIVPLERGTDFLRLHTGKKLEISFDQITVFATNLNPAELADEAFLRRLRHKIMVPYQSEKEFLQTFERVCQAQGIAYKPEVAAHLIDRFYRERGRKFTGSHPRDLIEQVIDRARYRRELPELSIEAIEAAASDYFVDL